MQKKIKSAEGEARFSYAYTLLLLLNKFSLLPSAQLHPLSYYRASLTVVTHLYLVLFIIIVVPK